jgi:hypothetical protein
VYFCHPLDETALVPVPSEIVARFRGWRWVAGLGGGLGQERVGFGGGAGYMEPGKRALTAKEHLVSRLAATYNFQEKV